MNAASAVPGFLDAWTGSLALFFILGLRHGAEPDHLAAVDGLTVLALDRHERHAAWTGALFALGHGLVVTALATAIAGFSGGFAMSDALAGVLDWIPILLLLAIGAFNLKCDMPAHTGMPSTP